MSIYKEVLHDCQTLVSKQAWLFNHTMVTMLPDTGLPYTKENVLAIKNLVNHWLCPLSDFKTGSAVGDWGKKATYHLPVEDNDYEPGMVDCFRIDIEYYKIPKDLWQYVINPGQFESRSMFNIKVSRETIPESRLK